MRPEIDRVAVHRIEAFDHDQGVAVFFAMLRQELFEMVEIVVAEHDLVGVRGAGAGRHAVMGQFVEEDRVALGHQVSDDRQVRQVARDQRQGRFHAQKPGEIVFELLVGRTLAADEAGGQRAHAQRIDGVMRGGLHLRVIGEAEIIVIGEGDEMPVAARLDFRLERVRGGEERVAVFLENGAASQAIAPVSVFRKAFVLFRHAETFRLRDDPPLVWPTRFPRRAIRLMTLTINPRPRASSRRRQDGSQLNHRPASRQTPGGTAAAKALKAPVDFPYSSASGAP